MDFEVAFESGQHSRILYFETLDKDLVKFSTKKLIISGVHCELFEFPRSYSFNWSPQQTRTDFSKSNAQERRDDSLKRSRDMIRRIVDANSFLNGYNPVFVTLTFGTEILTPQEANPVWTLFVKRLTYNLGRKFKYISVIEFQPDSKRVHYHVVFFDLPYIENIKAKLEEYWGEGWVKVNIVKHVKLLGHYVSKYLQPQKTDKKLVGQKAFFCSRNVIRPITIRSMDLIDNFVRGCTMSDVYQSEYSTHEGTLIRYKKFKIQHGL